MKKDIVLEDKSYGLGFWSVKNATIYPDGFVILYEGIKLPDNQKSDLITLNKEESRKLYEELKEVFGE